MSKAEYKTVETADGTWMHAFSTDFIFAFLKNDMDEETKTAMTNAFNEANEMSTTIKKVVEKETGNEVLHGVYLLDEEEMTTAMNSIDGMGMTSATQAEKSGSATAVDINLEFFAAVLGGLGGDVGPLKDYLQSQMESVQAQAKKSSSTKTFGTVIGLVSLMPVLNIPVTSFQYVYSSEETRKWFVDIVCVSVEHYTYNYKYTAANYNYVKSENASNGKPKIKNKTRRIGIVNPLN